MNINEVILKIKNFNNCELDEPKGIPKIFNNHILSEELKEFFKICGGARLFIDNDFGMDIVSPDRFVLANPVIIKELCEYDISSDWYIIGDDRNGNYITIDLNKGRLGKCYYSHSDCHAIAGSCPVIANSFTELLIRIIETKGEGTCWYWYEDDFDSLGDAYDGENL